MDFNLCCLGFYIKINWRVFNFELTCLDLLFTALICSSAASAFVQNFNELTADDLLEGKDGH